MFAATFSRKMVLWTAAGVATLVAIPAIVIADTQKQTSPTAAITASTDRPSAITASTGTHHVKKLARKHKLKAGHRHHSLVTHKTGKASLKGMHAVWLTGHGPIGSTAKARTSHSRHHASPTMD